MSCVQPQRKLGHIAGLGTATLASLIVYRVQEVILKTALVQMSQLKVYEPILTQLLFNTFAKKWPFF